MGRILQEYVAMKTDAVVASLIDYDIEELKVAANKLLHDATMLGGKGFGTSFFKWIASFAAMYKFNFHPVCQYQPIHIGEVGKWIAFIAVVLRLFFPRHFPDWLEIPGSMILILTVAPDIFAHRLRNNWIGLAIDLFIGCYLLQEHIRATGGFRNSFTQKHGISNTLGILLLIVYPICAFIIH
ncbi:hypothetical protein JHK87_045262 [Glycine soja]|nr:hypothetical protein JHK87_045262 [Glycine soja]